MKIALALSFALALAACNAGSGGGSCSGGPCPASGGGSTTTPSASSWVIEYSPGMPSHPTASGAGWSFAFPNSPNHVDYVVDPVSMAASNRISATVSVAVSGNPTFGYQTASNNTCIYPAHARLFFQERGDNMSGSGAYQYYRWWAKTDAGSFQLAPGSGTMTASFADPAEWSSVLGVAGNANATATAAFNQAKANIGAVGMTFGGGCFYGHGVYVSSGSASFSLSAFSAN